MSELVFECDDCGKLVNGDEIVVDGGAPVCPSCGGELLVVGNEWILDDDDDDDFFDDDDGEEW